MESTLYLFPIPEIEAMIIDFLDPNVDYKKIILLNKYFYQIIFNNETYQEFRQFSRMIKYSNCPKIQQINGIFYSACIYDYLMVAKYIYGKHSHMIKNNIHDGLLFRDVCDYGNVNIAKWLISLDDGIRPSNKYVFRRCCERGDLEMAKLLYSSNINIDIHEDNEYVFRCSCERGKIKVVKWLYSLNQNINIHASNEYAFRQSCSYGQFKIVKFLLSLDPKIDIHAENDAAFYYACCGRHLDIAKLIFSIDGKINKTVYDKLLFEKKVFDRDDIKIVKWLISLNIT